MKFVGGCDYDEVYGECAIEILRRGSFGANGMLLFLVDAFRWMVKCHLATQFQSGRIRPLYDWGYSAYSQSSLSIEQPPSRPLSNHPHCIE